MKYILRSLLFIIAILLMQGCATHEKFVMKYNAWVGQDINDLITQKGYPDSTYTLPNKNEVYVYERSRIYSYPSMSFGYGRYGGHYGGYGMYSTGSDIVQKTCKIYFETDKKDIIVKWGSRGNACVSN